MNDTINLNRARKAKLKAQARVAAAENRVRFGRSKTARSVESAERLRAEIKLDQAKRDPS